MRRRKSRPSSLLVLWCLFGASGTLSLPLAVYLMQHSPPLPLSALYIYIYFLFLLRNLHRIWHRTEQSTTTMEQTSLEIGIQCIRVWMKREEKKTKVRECGNSANSARASL